MPQFTESWKMSQFLRRVRRKTLETTRPVSLTLVPGIIMEIILGDIENHLRENVVSGDSQQGGEQPGSRGESPVR